MESENQDSLEDPSDYFAKRKRSTTTSEAAKIYVLMPKNIPVSRAARLQWVLDNLNSVVSVPSCSDLYSSNDLEIISAIPTEETGSALSHCLITTNTQVEFLAQSYRFVYCLDMSPSQTSVDIHLDEILFDEIISSFKMSLLGLCEKFTIPGNLQVFQPCIYLTVIVNTPFFISPAQQVLVKGVQISSQNVHDIIYSVQTQFHYIEGRIAHMSDLAYEQIDRHMQENEDFLDGLFDNVEPPQYISNIPVVSSDANFVNMLRYSMLANSLLPGNSLSNIIIITDGVVAMPDSNIMESILFQLHYDSIALSFIKVGSIFNPQISAGYVSYSDLLQFLSYSTLGTCLESLPVIDNTKTMNIYQELYLLWSFNSKIQFNSQMIHQKPILSRVNLYSNGIPPLLSKKQAEDDVKVPLYFLLYRRMREGYSVNRISLNNEVLEIRLCLHWKAYIYIQYILRSPWPLVSNMTHYEIHVTAPYDFLHDITCLMKKETKSSYRQAVFEKFWLHLIQLATNDTILQLSLFQNSCVWYNIPESVKSGIPLFVINESSSYDTNKLVLSVNDKSCPKFSAIWQPVCQIETNNWRKWFHVHKISCILKHDSPLLKNIHLVNSSGRYESIQCRQAVNVLYEFLSKWCSFVLIDNHTYLKLIGMGLDRPPLFCVIRVNSKLPCTTLNVGFMTGTSGKVRHKVIGELKDELAKLTYLCTAIKARENCCTILRKPLEKICIRYERVPSEFHTVIFPDGTQPPHSLQSLPVSPLAGTLFTTLSRYLFHQRWIWSANHPINPKLELKAISRILSTITRMRLKEGFNLAHSASGIITMTLELPMRPALSCIIQYVLFPPHDAMGYDDFHSISEDEQEQETDTELQIVTEVWIEPQYGTVAPTKTAQIKYMEDRYYYELSEKIRLSDLKCVNSLLTLEHLSLTCQPKSKDVPIETIGQFDYFKQPKFAPKTYKNTIENNSSNEDTESVWIPILVQRIQHIPFNFNPISILYLCQQTELLFSMFMEESALHLSDMEKSNILLLDNIYSDLLCIHDRELEITADDCVQFIEQVIERHKERLHSCPLGSLNLEDNSPGEDTVVKWRCFLKGVSVTHVILTFIPASLKDTQNFILNSSQKSSPSMSGSSTSIASQSTSSDVPINSKHSYSLPIFVYDCPLAALVDACINSHDNSIIYSRDIFEDHRFKNGSHIMEERISLKYEDDQHEKSESENPDHSAKNHCKTLVLTHCKCFATSLFSALHQDLYVHSSDVQAAMDQCEETVYEIDITEYLQTVCGHLKQQESNNVEVSHLQNSKPCQNLKPMHRLIKEKFLGITSEAFSAIPTNKEFYYCHNVNFDKIDKASDSDDEISNSPSDVMDFKSDSNVSGYICKTTTINLSQICPLFLHYICTIRYGDSNGNMSVKVLPTCIGEIVSVLDNDLENIDTTNLQVTLDVLCLTLPVDVQNVINGYSAKGLRTTSFCSDGFQTSISGSASEISCSSTYNLEDNGCLMNLPDVQKRAINVLIEEIKWLLKDEIATSLLDIEPVTITTLKFISKHITNSTSRKSCVLDIIDLNFVYEPSQSHKKFVQEFFKISIPDYKLCKVEDLYYLSKNSECNNEVLLLPNDLEDDLSDNDDLDLRDHSENYSQSTSLLGMDAECDSYTEDEKDFKWLLELHDKRHNLPNFWLITEINNNSVIIYFHCRYLELQTTHVGMYLEVQRAMCDAIKDLCKHVNQYLLLHSLHDSRSCNILLEPDDSFNDWQNDTSSSTVNKPFSRLKSMDEITDESETYPTALVEATLKFKAGYFSCPVVWETHFVLHPRLKTGPGKSGLSIGILALQKVLDKFSVSNRNNMFVYQDSNLNVFYLRLHENLNYYHRNSQLKANGFENVSRSPSVASLPLGHPHSIQPNTDANAIPYNLVDIRPRVQSVSEKESKEDPQDDTIILKVHGITETGQDIKCDLVQVLQNRLDDTVLEILSVMLARNSMCPLTPEDVRFLQKPFKQPEYIVRLSVQDYAAKLLYSFIYYLRQNLLQFLNIPKYTDSRSHYHFKDYVECEQTNKLTDDNIFIYNQSQSPTSGNRGISCIALAIINNSKEAVSHLNVNFEDIYMSNPHADVVECNILDSTDTLPNTYLEFRLWNQGRVNIQNLCQKLCASVSQANWDIIMEYYLLVNPLCVESNENVPYESSSNNLPLNNAMESQRKIILDSTLQQSNMTPRIINYELKFDRLPPYFYRKTVAEHFSPQKYFTRELIAKDLPVKVDSFETGDEGILSSVYSLKLADWLEFAASLNVPAVKKCKVSLNFQHSLNTTVKELQNLVMQLSQDAVRTFVLDEMRKIHIPFNSSKNSNQCILIARNFEHWKLSVGEDSSISIGEFLNGNALKHILKFVPTVINDKFIPRQKILWASLNCNEIIIYTYNWSKDNMDKLIEQGTNLGLWLTLRGGLLSSMTSQKLGLFHDQVISRKSLHTSNNPYVGSLTDVDCMLKFPKEKTRRSSSNAIVAIPPLLDAFKDTYRIITPYVDTTITNMLEMCDIKQSEKRLKDDLRNLHSMYQSRSSTATSTQIQIMMQNSRNIHYCHTPLLFLARWRLQAARTRDHTVTSKDVESPQHPDNEELWHKDLCTYFISEYKHYLQTLGFMTLQIENVDDKNHSLETIHFMQKALLGGILIFTIELREPFLITKLHAIEYNRLHANNTRSAINQFMQSFMDECDKVKFFMHLHSFTYDFHLRCVYNYISNNNYSRLKEGYYITHFLDDFMKYYSKAPNYARNLVYTDTVTIANLLMEGKELYEYFRGD
ncbi:hypothetical protein Trydic_g21981 [Trypoxylus dichotomus]